ncbi:hypothetical protein V8C44DRAFT_349450 [Trichoderma aethiopicum]
MNYGTTSEAPSRLPSSRIDPLQMASPTTPPMPDAPEDAAIRALGEAGLESILQDPPSHIWRSLLQAGLKKKKFHRFSQRLDPKFSVDHIHGLFEQHHRRRLDGEYLAAMEPVVEALFHKSQAVTQLFKASHKSAKNCHKILSHISTFLQGLTSLLPRLGEYITLFPCNQRLHQAVRGICDIYPEACVYTAVYLDNANWKNVLRGIFRPGTDYRVFADAVDKLERYQAIIESEVRLAFLHEFRAFSSQMIEDGQDEA